MAYNKITAEDTTGKGNVGMPDVPGLSTLEMQKKLDELSKDVIIPHFNELIDEVEKDFEESKLITDKAVISETIKAIKVNADGQIEISLNGTDFVATASSGHIIIDGDNRERPQRSRLKFTNTTISDVDGVTVVAGIKGDKGPQGDPTTVNGKTGPSIVLTGDDIAISASDNTTVKERFKKNLLWRNADTSAPFNDQLLYINASEYSTLIIVMRQDIAHEYFSNFYVNTDKGIRIVLSTANYSDFNIISRDVSVNSDNLNFSSGYKASTYGEYTVANDVLIPYIIYGVK